MIWLARLREDITIYCSRQANIETETYLNNNNDGRPSSGAKNNFFFYSLMNYSSFATAKCI